MNIISKFATWDRKFPWSFLGFILAVVFGGLTIYNEFFKNPNPDLSIQILSDNNVLDVREHIPELRIIYGDVDIKNLNQTLSVVVFRVQNLGGAAILNSFYEEKASPSIVLSVGKFVKVEQIAATSEYLAASARPTLASQDTLLLPRVIVEPGESYTLKALLLHGPRSGVPFKAIGKIAGAKNIPVFAAETGKQEESFWLAVVSGTISVQLLRAPIYFVGFLALLAAFFGPLFFVSQKLEAATRNRMIKQFEKHHKHEINQSEFSVLEAYREYGLSPLVRIRDLLGNEEKLKHALDLMEKIKSESSYKKQSELGNDRLPLFVSQGLETESIDDADQGIPMQALNSLRIAAVAEDGSCKVDKEIEQFLCQFIDYVVIKDG